MMTVWRHTSEGEPTSRYIWHYIQQNLNNHSQQHCLEDTKQLAMKIKTKEHNYKEQDK